MTVPEPLTPAEHRERAEAYLRQLQSSGPGSMAWHGLAQAAIAHAGIAISDGLDTLAAYLEPPPEPDLPGLPLGWRVTTRQSGNGARKWGWVLTRPGREPESSEYRYESSPGAVMAGLKYAPTLPDFPRDTEDDTTGD